jgi:hypothetical protein
MFDLSMILCLLTYRLKQNGNKVFYCGPDLTSIFQFNYMPKQFQQRSRVDVCSLDGCISVEYEYVILSVVRTQVADFVGMPGRLNVATSRCR